jgi:hypothetical protein
MNLFELAGLQLAREGKYPNNLSELLKRAILIRKWLDKHREATARRILAGDKIYYYRKQIKTYARAI